MTTMIQSSQTPNNQISSLTVSNSLNEHFASLKYLCKKRSILLNQNLPTAKLFDGFVFDHRKAHFLQISEHDPQTENINGKRLIEKEQQLITNEKSLMILEYRINLSQLSYRHSTVQKILNECAKSTEPIRLFLCNEKADNFIMSNDFEKIDEKFSSLKLTFCNARHIISNTDIMNRQINETKNFVENLKEEISILKTIVPSFYKAARQRKFKKEFEELKFEYKANCLCLNCTENHAFLNSKLL